MVFYIMAEDTEQMAISEFKATCLAVLERIRRTGRSIVITRRGEPVAEVIPPPPALAGPKWLGALAGRGRIAGDLLEPAADIEEWEALQG
jgi:prevent-host-death family protein